MPVSSVSTHNVIPLHSTAEVKNGSILFHTELTDRIRKIENSMVELKESIKAYKKDACAGSALLEGLNAIEKKHGRNATLRLKNGQFKYGEASCFFKKIFHASRYASEREAAAKKMEVNGNTVSTWTAISILQEKVVNAEFFWKSELKELAEYDNKRKQCHREMIGNPVKVNVDVKKLDEASKKVRQDFSMIFQTNAGCAGINAEARFQSGQATFGGRVRGGAVVGEYHEAHGDNIFSRGNKAVEHTILARCNNLPELVKNATKEFYTPSENTITTWRGQGMSRKGINTLIAKFRLDKETVYQPGQFFSTSKSAEVADKFAMNSQGDVKVKFTVKGNSSHGLSVKNGLLFTNNEKERLYSPLANFKVTAISMPKANTYKVALEEVSKRDRAQFLPR